jgi:hypothetical protein
VVSQRGRTGGRNGDLCVGTACPLPYLFYLTLSCFTKRFFDVTHRAVQRAPLTDLVEALHTLISVSRGLRVISRTDAKQCLHAGLGSGIKLCYDI